MADQEKSQFELIVEKERAEVEAKAKQYFYTQKKRMPYSKRDFDPTEIDPTPHYRYDMSCYFWDSTTGRMSKRYRFAVELTDDEYIYLLTEQLLDRSPNTYNRLVFDRPDLAEKICDNSELAYYYEFAIRSNPYLIILDEVLEDAEAIEGPASVDEQIYSDADFPTNYSISGHTEGRQLFICEDDCFGARPLSELRKLENIDADQVQKLLNTHNYTQMLYAIRALCTTSSPFDAIKTWLDKNHLSYKESTVQ